MKRYYDYMESSRVNIYLVVLPPYAQRYLHFLARLQFAFMGIFLKLKKYDIINVVGQNRPLLDLIKRLSPRHNVFTSLHEVTSHYASQTANRGLVEYLSSKKMNVIVHCSASRQRFLEFPGAAADCVHTIPFGVFETYSLFDDLQCRIMPDNPYILNYGTILPYKGVDVLYEAVQILGSRLNGMKIVVAGAGTNPCLAKMARDPRFIIINRYLSNEEIVSLNKRAYCVVCPYKSASQSGIVSTTFLFGKPIVASDVGGFSEYIKNGENGLLVPANEPKALAESLSRLIANDSLYNRLCEGASAFSASADYSWDAIAEKYLNLFYSSSNSLQKAGA
ncbi:MAG: glycosyltransferase family 4 protein [Planctomycetaceae bacterium]|nr:glycosyltransferase family 4 protein [Planctomycetaceae bacterium]